MTESAWHNKVRTEYRDLYAPNAIASHEHITNLNLFRGEIKIENCLSDADIMVIDPGSGRIIKIIEIETALNPKKIMGIVMATHVCDFCRAKSIDRPKTNLDYHLKDIELQIVYQAGPQESKKDLKRKIIKRILNKYIKEIRGCISKLTVTERE